MSKTLQILTTLVLLSVLAAACGERQNEEAQGRETELSGDEPDETAISNTQESAYDPGDTVVTLSKADIPDLLQAHLLVVVDSYLNIGEALMNDSAEVAQAEATELENLLLRHEQENMDLQPEVRDFYTNAAHVIRQSAQNIMAAGDIGEIRSLYAAMAPAAYKMAKLTDFDHQSLYYQYCSQSFDNRGAYWLSPTQEVRNPYAAQANKDCVETVARL